MGISFFIIYYNVYLPNALKGFLFFIQVVIKWSALCLLNVATMHNYNRFYYVYLLCIQLLIYFIPASITPPKTMWLIGKMLTNG